MKLNIFATVAIGLSISTCDALRFIRQIKWFTDECVAGSGGTYISTTHQMSEVCTSYKRKIDEIPTHSFWSEEDGVQSFYKDPGCKEIDESRPTRQIGTCYNETTGDNISSKSYSVEEENLDAKDYVSYRHFIYKDHGAGDNPCSFSEPEKLHLARHIFQKVNECDVILCYSILFKQDSMEFFLNKKCEGTPVKVLKPGQCHDMEFFGEGERKVFIHFDELVTGKDIIPIGEEDTTPDGEGDTTPDGEGDTKPQGSNSASVTFVKPTSFLLLAYSLYNLR